MKKIILIMLMLHSWVFANLYDVNSKNAEVGFSITKFKINDDVVGKFSNVKGTYDFDNKAMTVANINIEIPLDTVKTGDEDRDTSLKTEPMFFEIAKFGNQMTFATEKGATFLMNKDKATVVKGKLTIKGNTKDVELTVVYKGLKNGRPNFIANTEINRHDFGITWNKDYNGEVLEKYKAIFANKVLADMVKINIALN